MVETMKKVQIQIDQIVRVSQKRKKYKKNKATEEEDNVDQSNSESDKKSQSQAATRHQQLEKIKKRRTELNKLLKPELIEKII